MEGYVITKITSKGQTVVPSNFKREYELTGGSLLEWIDTGEILKVIPVPKDVMKALRGCANYR